MAVRLRVAQTSMTDILLGLIALGTFTTALLQVIVIVSLVRSARRAFTRIERLRAMVAPLPAHLSAIRDDLQRAQDLAQQQLGRIALIYDIVEAPVRHGMTALAILRGVRSVVGRGRK